MMQYHLESAEENWGNWGEKTEKRHAQFCLLAVAVTLFHSIDTYMCACFNKLLHLLAIFQH